MINNKTMPLTKTITWVTLFSIAMGFLETAVVVYLRALYYPEGFDFPLQLIDQHIAITELLREAATMLMLVGIGVLSGRTGTEKFGWFIYSFAIWDITYYVFLKMLLGWPASMMTWDILFLIPVTWVGPVVSPVILSLSMIILALGIATFTEKQWNARIQGWEWVMLMAGSLVVIFSFCLDYSQFILEHYTFSEIWTLPSNEQLYNLSTQYAPRHFSWWIFWAGEGLILGGIGKYFYRMIAHKPIFNNTSINLQAS